MYQRDYILNETRKLAQLLAKLMGLKADGEHEEYRQQFDKILQNEYNVELDELLRLDENGFKGKVQEKAYSAEKLNALSQLLYVFAEPFENDAETKLTLRKILILFEMMADIHRTESFENIEKRKFIYRFLIQHERP